MKSKIQSISNGGSIKFQYSFGDENCDSICKSKYVQKGCKYGFRCNVDSKYQTRNYLCTMEMSCNSATLDETSGISETTSAQYLGNCQNINVY